MIKKNGTTSKRQLRILAIFVFLLISIYFVLWLFQSSEPHMIPHICLEKIHVEDLKLELNPNNHSIKHQDVEALSAVVTCFFPISKSKHPFVLYEEWIFNFFKVLNNGAAVIYTTEEMANLISVLQMNSKFRNRELIFITDIEDVFQIPPLAPFKTQYKTTQHSYDPEQERHSAELYAVWNGKAWMVENVLTRNYFPNLKYIFWADIGSFRNVSDFPNQTVVDWPSIERLEFLDSKYHFTDPKDPKLLLTLVAAPVDLHLRWFRSFEPKTNRHAGGFFGGSPIAALWFSRQFYSDHNYFINHNYFVGKDQTIMNNLARCQRERFLEVIGSTQHVCNEWFFFQRFLYLPQLLPKEYEEADFTLHKPDEYF